MAFVGFLVFASAFATSIAVFWFTLVPALPRIAALLRDGAAPIPTAPAVIVSEARLRARVRATAPSARPRWRAAA